MPALGAGSIKKSRLRKLDDSAQVKVAVASGVDYFKRRCDDQIPTVIALEQAIASKDLAAAKLAYIESRPPYEEIETIAGSFEDSDRDIDARPYSFDGGEDDPDFRGFHKIENLIFAEEDLDAAHPYAVQLVESIKRLRGELDESDRFNAEGQFGGMVALTNELSAKKISSEEETWSDQSLLIFKHNWLGVNSQFIPFGQMVGADKPSVIAVAVAHRDAMNTLKPYFKPGVVAAAPYSGLSNRERRAIADASNRYRDAIIVVRDEIGVPG
ncbi:MAG: EfeM/EfeO family lipoprotein [Phycisphaerae bacterium]|nr:EfeM/EfeO family lipoprotein [Phycisphaerae bacterium]